MIPMTFAGLILFLFPCASHEVGGTRSALRSKPKESFRPKPEDKPSPLGEGGKNIPLVRSCGPKNAPWSQDSTPETTFEHPYRMAPICVFELFLYPLCIP